MTTETFGAELMRHTVSDRGESTITVQASCLPQTRPSAA
jgi:hypothetical protein